MTVRIPGLKISEKDWQRTVIEAAEWRGWFVDHTFPLRQKDGGIRTPSTQPGRPDLTLLRERTVWAELKSQTGKLSDAQKAYIERLRSAGAEVYVWRPSDWPEVERVLARKR